jgi:hypothetical protein
MTWVVRSPGGVLVVLVCICGAHQDHQCSLDVYSGCSAEGHTSDLGAYKVSELEETSNLTGFIGITIV